MQSDISSIFGTAGASADNLYTFFIWGTVGLVVFAFLYLYFNFKKAVTGEQPKSHFIPIIKWALLFASAGFNVFFTYYVFLPAGQILALSMAFVMGGVNLAEAYLVKLTIASWRHGLTLIFKIALFLIVPLFSYSLMSAGSSFATMMNKNKDTQKASQLELSASNDRINESLAKLKEAQAGEQGGFLLANLQTSNVRNSRGVSVSFGKIKNSCERGGYYARAYPQLCNQYLGLKNGSFKAGDVARAEQQANRKSSEQKLKMAQILKDRPPEIMPTLLGFSLGIAFVGFIVSLALESAIVGVGFFEEIFINPTVLPANISFLDKKLDWNEKEIIQKGLQIDTTPSPHISFNSSQIASPFSSVTDTRKRKEKTYIVSFDGIEKATKKGQSAKEVINIILGYIKKNNRLENFYNIEIKAENTNDERDVYIYIIRPPTLTDEQIIFEPKKVQKDITPEPKQVQNKEIKSESILNTKGRGRGSKRKGKTPDTGTKGITANRYNAIKKAIEQGKIKGTLREIKAFKMDGVGVGDGTAQKFRKALIRDGIL